MTTKQKPSRPAATPSETVSAPLSDLAALPAPVARMREKILEACDKGDIEAMRIPIDWNEVRPLFERGAKHPAGTDPIAVLKALSFDGKGQEILRLAKAVLAQPFVRITRGPFQSYEWPAFARVPTPLGGSGEAQALWACVRFADLARSNEGGKPIVMRLGIGSDGVWHYFWSGK
jgi:hypothetical protein